MLYQSKTTYPLNEPESVRGHDTVVKLEPSVEKVKPAIVSDVTAERIREAARIVSQKPDHLLSPKPEAKVQQTPSTPQTEQSTSSLRAQSKENVTRYPHAIQVLSTSVQYAQGAQKKIDRLNALGLECQLEVGHEKSPSGEARLYGRCNFVDGFSKLKPAIALCEQHGIDYFVVTKEAGEPYVYQKSRPKTDQKSVAKKSVGPTNTGNEELLALPRELSSNSAHLPAAKQSEGVRKHPYSLQVLSTSKQNRKSAQRRIDEINDLGLSCYLQEGEARTPSGDQILYGRCNDSDGYSRLKPAIALLEQNGVDYFVVARTAASTLPAVSVQKPHRLSSPARKQKEQKRLSGQPSKRLAKAELPKASAEKIQTANKRKKVELPYKSQGFAQVGTSSKAKPQKPVETQPPSKPSRSKLVVPAQSGTLQQYSNIYKRIREGTPGLSELDKTLFGIELDAQVSPRHRIFAELGMVHLDKGTMSRDEYGNFGTGGSDPLRRDLAKQSGIETEIGYTYYADNYVLEAEAGMTPLVGGAVDASPTWRVEASGEIGAFSGYGRMVKKALKDSMLSYVGERDLFSDASWGRVMKRGIAAGVMYSNGFTTTVDLEYYSSIEGENTLSNSESKVTARLIRNLDLFDFYRFAFGAKLIYDDYDFNTEYFSYGQGGYFSPQSYLHYALCFDMITAVGGHSLLQLKGSVGAMSFERGVPKAYMGWMPEHSGDIEEVDELAMEFAAHYGIGFGDEFQLLGSAGYTNRREVDEYFLGLFLGFYFNKTEIDVEDFRRIEQFYEE